MKGYKEKNEKDLIKELLDKRQELRSFRFAIWGSKTRNTKEGRDIKKDIARIKTELRRRELEGAGQSSQ